MFSEALRFLQDIAAGIGISNFLSLAGILALGRVSHNSLLLCLLGMFKEVRFYSMLNFGHFWATPRP